MPPNTTVAIETALMAEMYGVKEGLLRYDILLRKSTVPL